MATIAEQVLDRAIAVGTQKSTEASSAANEAMLATLGYSTLSAPTVEAVAAPIEPNVYIPSQTNGVDTALYNSTYDRIFHDLSGQFSAFFTQFFPADSRLMADVNDWLTNAIENGGSGINAVVEDQIWQRDRDRIYRQASAAADEAISMWAAKGFPLPAGAAIAAVQQVNRDRDQKVYEASRERAIKSWEMEYENVKFAIQQAIDFRVKAVQAAGDYIRTLALAPQVASGMSTAALGAQANLINAAANFYNSRIRVQELKQEVLKDNAKFALAAGEKNMDGFNARIQNQTNAAVSIAQSLGAQASAALNAVNGTSQLIQTLEG